MVRRNIVFTEVEDDDFQAMITSYNKGVADYLIHSSQTMRNWVEEEYLYTIIEIEKVLAASNFKDLYLVRLVDVTKRICVLRYCSTSCG